MKPNGQADALDTRERLVGPVLQPGAAAEAIIAAIRELNERVSVMDRGSYLRVQVPERCFVTRKAIESRLGQAFQLPGDLELLMPSFAGYLAISDDQAAWTWTRGSDHGH